MYSPLKQVNAERWNAFVIQHPDAHLLQLNEWGTLKSRFGWSAEIVAIGEASDSSSDSSTRIVAGALILYRRLPLHLGTRGYIPAGPLFFEGDADPKLPANQALWQAIDQSARQHHAVYIKIEPCDWYRPRPGLTEQLHATGLLASNQTEQPPRTVILDIGDSDEAILKRMNQSTRYKSKLKEKKEITVREATTADLDSFTALMKITGERDAFGIYEPDYYRTVFQLFHNDNNKEIQNARNCALLIASHQGQDLAGVMVLYCGENAYYLYGGSSNAERNRMPTYILQWEAIQWAKRHGAMRYDMWGVPDADETELEEHFEKRRAGLWGVYGFKRGFGGRVVRSIGAWDKVYNPVLYHAYRLYAERRHAPAARSEAEPDPKPESPDQSTQ